MEPLVGVEDCVVVSDYTFLRSRPRMYESESDRHTTFRVGLPVGIVSAGNIFGKHLFDYLCKDLAGEIIDGFRLDILGWCRWLFRRQASLGMISRHPRF